MAILSPEDHEIVSSAVAEAELGTSGEIVPVVAQASDGYSDVVLWWAIAIAFTAMSVFAWMPQFYLGLWDGLRGGWGHDGWTPAQIASLIAGFALLKFLGSWLLLQIPALRFFFIPGPVKAARVRDAAVRHFKVGAQARTQGRTGVLLYLSIAEHRAEIVADEAIAAIVPAEVWGAAMADMLGHIRAGRMAEGIAAGVRDVGAVLAEHFPRSMDDTNELPDRLIEL